MGWENLYLYKIWKFLQKCERDHNNWGLFNELTAFFNNSAVRVSKQESEPEMWIFVILVKYILLIILQNWAIWLTLQK